jgi:hypothetical protein
MEDLGQRLCDVIQHAVNAAEPETSLRAVVALREDLNAFEEAQVARALHAGASYGDVARIMGISRQAAHRRYRGVAGGDGGTAGADGASARGRILITSEARVVVRFARQEAAALGARAVGTEHLLLGVLHFDACPAAEALRELGVDLAAARANAQVTLVGASTDGVPEGPRGISPHARAVFEQSLHAAVRRGDGYIGVEHLLVAALGDPDSGAYQTLEALGVDPASLAAKL